MTSILASQIGARQQQGLEVRVRGGSQTCRQIIPLITRLCVKSSPTPHLITEAGLFLLKAVSHKVNKTPPQLLPCSEKASFLDTGGEGGLTWGKRPSPMLAHPEGLPQRGQRGVGHSPCTNYINTEVTLRKIKSFSSRLFVLILKSYSSCSLPGRAAHVWLPYRCTQSKSCSHFF